MLLLDAGFLILVNAYWDEVTFTLPPVLESPSHGSWNWAAATRRLRRPRVPQAHTGDPVVARPRSVRVLRVPRSEG